MDSVRTLILALAVCIFVGFAFIVAANAHHGGGNGQGGPDTIVGTAGDDKLVGGHGPDVLVGLAGNDRLWGGRGPDVFDCGPGFDIVNSHAPGHNTDTIAASCEEVR